MVGEMKASELINILQSVIIREGDIEVAYDRREKIPMSLGVYYVSVCRVADSGKKLAVMTETPYEKLQPERPSAATSRENPEQADCAAQTGGELAAAPCSASPATEARQAEMIGRVNLAECYFIDGEGAHGMQPERGRILAYHSPTDELVFISPAGPFHIQIARCPLSEVAELANLTTEQVDTLRKEADLSIRPTWKTVLG